MVAENQQVQSHFVTRVSSLPTVEAALEIAMSSYNKLKNASPASIKAVMEAGEKTTNMALSTSQPILNKLQGPIQFVDTYACQGLDRVEQTVPAVKETPDKIYADVKQYGAEKVNAVVGYGNQKLQQIGLGAMAPGKLAGYASTALTVAEGALDSHLASAGAQVPVMENADGDIRTRVGHVTTKARLCVSHHASARFAVAMNYASDGVGRVLEALQVIRALKSNVQEGKSVQEIAQELKFEWLSKLLEEAKDKPATQQALFVAQAAAREAQDALNKASNDMKSKVNDAFTAVLSRAGELNTTLHSVSVSQLSTSVLTTIHDQAQHLQNLIRQLTGRSEQSE
ncbi:perilipin-3 isoform X2 [Galendromus occidentalis]|nr:perilipin-3 isoform X2 [Galendromus occidentalis]XP_003745361.1 perilipin-3 isoform X2 [Galendromus occidentalis]